MTDAVKFVKNEWLGNRELIMRCLTVGRFEVLDSDNNYKVAFKGDYSECEEFMLQQYIEYEENRIG
jgi:hypothetical protein